MSTPFELLSRVTAQAINEEFGKSIAQAMQTTFGDKASYVDYAAAGIICSLFLSSILEGFPTSKLHTFVRNYHEENSLFSFDCKSYDRIAANITSYHILMLDSKLCYIYREIEKQELLESFDFFTNR